MSSFDQHLSLTVSVLYRASGSGVRDGEQLWDREALRRGIVEARTAGFPAVATGIIDHLKLRQPVYRKTAAYGHFGRKQFAWERADAKEELVTKAKNT